MQRIGDNSMPIKRVLAIVGLETIYDGKNHRWKHSDTFLNNILTYEKEHPYEEVFHFDARRYKDMINPLRQMFNELADNCPCDELIYSGHSGPNKLYVFFRYPEEKPDNCRFITKDTDWRQIIFSEHAEIKLWGCQTIGQNGKRQDDCIGQWIADATNRPVWGYTTRSSQKLVNGGFYMRSSTPLQKVIPRC